MIHSFFKNLMSTLALLFIITFIQLGCKNDGPSEPPPPDIIIPSTTKTVDSTTFAYRLVSISSDSSTFVFNKGSETIDKLQTNDIIVTNKGMGMLRKVTQVSKSNTRDTVWTTQAVITEAIQKGSTSFIRTLTSNDTLRTLYKATGVQLQKSNINPTGFFFRISELVIYDYDGNYSTTTDQIVANGTIDITPTVTYIMSIDDWQLRHIQLSTTISEDLDLRLRINLLALDVKKKKEIYRAYLAPITTFIGPVPIVITPVMTINVGVDAKVFVAVTTGIRQHADLTAGLVYKNGDWAPIADLNHSFDFDTPTITAGAKLKGYIGPQWNFLLFGVAGPYTEISLFGELDADISRNPWAILYSGIQVGAGVRVEIFSHQLVDYYKPDIVGLRVKLWESSNMLTLATLSASSITSNSAMLNGTVNSNGLSTNTWFEYGTSSTLSTYINTSSQNVGSGSNIINFNQSVSSLISNTTYYFRIVASNSDGTKRGEILYFTTPESWSIIELQNDDGLFEQSWSWGGACPLDGNMSDGAIGFRKFLNSLSYPLKVLRVRAYFASKNTSNAGFYLHIKNQSGEDLLPTPFLVGANEVSLGDWWELDVSSYDITIDSGRIEVGIYENYLPANCPPPNWSINGWTILADKHSSGNSIMKGPTQSFDPGHEFMIRLKARVPNADGKIIAKSETSSLKTSLDKILIRQLSTESKAVEIERKYPKPNK
ncbi:MAG: hypothetical protein HYZ34_05645 [Ignavibacteriae bacterium]|nr:hypothetical protein [Ignavibacteriota bacterium]